MTNITLHLTPVEAKLIHLALCGISIASTRFVKADGLQRKIGRALELHKLAQKSIEKIKKA